MPTFVERAVWGNGDGSGMQVYETDFGRIGGLICGEHLMTLARAHLISQGEEIHLGVFPGAFRLHTGPKLEEQDDTGEYFWGYASCRAHSFEAGSFVMASCGIMTEDAIPSDFALRDTLNIDYAKGGSAVYAPTTVPMVGPIYGDDIIYADCPSQMIKIAKAIVDTCGHYSRSDLFHLEVGSNVPNNAKTATRALETVAPSRLREIADTHEVAPSEIEATIENMVTLLPVKLLANRSLLSASAMGRLRRC